jgi:lipopolysaccharide/colanic/teichoic acid biosynthesis glycosyltransferase
MTYGGTRLLDRLLALVGLIGTAPLSLVAALGIKLSDPGPVLYRAARAGVGGVPFTMYKLRTMRVAPPGQAGARITGGRDTRVFPWGRLLRRLKLDELPQLINVVTGDMAIVGPRPEDPSIVARDYAPWMHETLTVLPGLTSPGTLGYYADESELPQDPAAAERIYLERLLPHKLAIDLVYVRNRTAWYDATLIVRTLAGVVGLSGIFGPVMADEAARADQILREVST